MSVIKPPKLISIVSRALWLGGVILTLGYAPKYYRRVKEWQVYDPSHKDSDHRAYSTQVKSSTIGLKSSARAKQQKEWDRLIMPLSVITATSAAALAIPSPFASINGSSNLHWVALALYTAAFGLSLEGLLLIMYLTVFAAGSSAETIGRMASGRDFLKGKVGPVAVVTALPTAIATYSSLFLLAGLLAMTIVTDVGSVGGHLAAFRAIVLVPVCLMFVSVAITVAGCEMFAWKEARAREEKEQSWGDVAEPESMQNHQDISNLPTNIPVRISEHVNARATSLFLTESCNFTIATSITSVDEAMSQLEPRLHAAYAAFDDVLAFGWELWTAV
ncbi:Transmembrane protein [Ceratobasidium theobromae]|uniref:Transmembrane protein n=1 Tax=Ceratobasidium theobromae TaxID=1582974 RepID=A0A5N5QMH2_9AGAM|nr:Transmembrane protein [Ceratobasidium theobromae]